VKREFWEKAKTIEEGISQCNPLGKKKFIQLKV
jgi:hypothetical protein